ncbi:MAG: TonB-dependent receptor [Bacteroidota bacterium]
MRCLGLFLLLSLARPALGQTVVTGAVTDGDGAPVAFATVLVAGTSDGAATASDGRFAFRTTASGRRIVEARFVGYEPARARVRLGADTVRVDLVLREQLVDLGAAVVSADAFVAGAEVEGLSPLDVVTTPGAGADLFQAIRSFPGVSEAEEGAGLFVRGGDVAETAVVLDGATLLQPYQFESPQGGARSAVSPWLVRGTRFSTGGFSARYGDALSGVLALDSQDEPAAGAQTLDVGLAGASLGADVPLGRGGLRLAGTQTFTDALFWVNGRADEFESAPEATTGSLLASVPMGAAGRLKAVALGNTDRFGLRLDDPSFAGVFESDARNGLALVEWTDLRAGWAVAATASHAGRSSEQRFGALRLRPGAARTALRTTAERTVAHRTLLHLGAEAERREASYRGEVPAGDVADPEAAVTTFAETTRGARLGAWAEVETQATRRLVVIAGLRADHHDALGATVLDPRVSALIALDDETRLRVAAGRYSQAPDLGTVSLDQATNPDGPGLDVQRATHLIAGVLHEGGRVTLRAEAYAKTYRDLVVTRSGDVFGSVGEGHARGVDLFARLGAIETDRWSGWVSYSYLDASRTGVRRDGLDARLGEGTPTFAVRHSLNAVGKWRATSRLTTAARFRLGGGRSVTPIEGAVPAPEGDFFYPVDGPLGSETLPAYTRLDVTLTYSVPLGRRGSLVLYAASDNVLDRANAIGYRYAPDYTSRTLDASPFRRSVYAGATVILTAR